MKGLPLRLPRVSPRLGAAVASGLALAVVLALAGPLLSVGFGHPLAPAGTRVALVLLVLWGAGLWALRRSLLGPVLGLGCLLIVQGGAELAWAQYRPLRPLALRALLVGLIVLGYLAWLAWRAWRRDGREHDLRQLAGAVRRLLFPTPAEALPERMYGALALQLQEAQRQWRQLHARGGWRGRLDAWHARKELPWYLLLGAEGAGKSSLLAASSLRLLRCQSMDVAEAEPAACTCWLGERAIFVESPGASDSLRSPGAVGEDAQPAPGSGAPAPAAVPTATAAPGDDPSGAQSSAAAAPADADARWGALLQGLRGRGAQAALHGVILAVEVPLLLQGVPERLAQSALAARRQLLQLRATLGASPPVHLVLTKADSLSGFEEYFGALDAHARRRERQDLWGFVLPEACAAGSAPHPGALLRDEFELLHRRLEQLLPACLEQEFSLQGRCRMYELPHAYAELAVRLRGWIDTVFAPWPEAPAGASRGRPARPVGAAAAPGLRGVFLESCTSCGAEPPLPSEPGRFVAGILRTVLAADAASGLALAPSRARRRRRRGFAVAASLLAAAGAFQVLHLSYARTRGQLDVLGHQTEGLQAQAATALRLPPGTQAWEGALQGAQDLLDACRGMRAAWPLGAMALQPVRGAAQAVALRLQTALLAPRLAADLRVQIEQAMQRDDDVGVFAALRAYLMLHDPASFEAPVLLAWVRGHASNELLERALRAPAGVLQDPLPADDALIQRAREWLLRRGRPQRLWFIVREQLPRQLEPAEYSLATWQGTRAERPFRLASGRPLNRGVPGWFSPQAWDGVIAPHLAQWAAAAGSVDRRVLGEGAGVASDELLSEELRHAYWLEYAREWSAFLGDIRPQPMPGVEPQLQYLQSMAGSGRACRLRRAGPSRRRRPVLARPGRSVRAACPPAPSASRRPARTRPPAACRRGSSWPPRWPRCSSRPASLAGAAPPRGLRRLRPGAATPADEQRPGRRPRSARRAGAPVLATPGVRDRARASSRKAAQLYARIAAAFQEQVAQPCARTLANRFPLRRDGPDADLEDFRAFFAPAGAADSYFRGYLQPWVDTSSRPWRYRSAAAPGPGLQSAAGGASSPDDSANGPVARELLDLLRKRGPDPEAFARVAQVRNALWRNGAGPQWDFDLSVPELDTGWAMLRVDVDARDMRYAHGPVLPWHATWPAQSPGSGHARLRFEGLDAGDVLEIDAQGPWAWMHLLARGQRLGTPPGGGIDLAYGPKGRRAVLHVGGPEPNPWKPGLLEGLQCPR